MRYLTFLLVAVFCSFQLQAQNTDFFWSTNDLNTGAANGPLSLNVVDGTGSLFLYYAVDGPLAEDIDIGAFFDVATSRPGVIRFTNAEVFNPTIGIVGTDDVFGNRWINEESNDATGGIGGNVSEQFINEWGAFGLFLVEGIKLQNTGPVILDNGFDQQANAFLFGRVDFEVIGLGRVDILIGRGQLGIAQSAPVIPNLGAEFVQPTFGSASIVTGKLDQPFLRGDVNFDGEVNLLDVDPFVNFPNSAPLNINADINGDGQLDLLDVAPFVALLTGGDTDVPDPSVENTVPEFGMLGDTTDDGFIDLLDVGCFQNIDVDCGVFQNTDINGDGQIDLLDVPGFVEIILQQK